MEKDERSATKERSGNWRLGAAVVTAVAASACCLGPLVLLGLGISSAWISRLTALEPYRPLFIGLTLVFLGYAFYGVYRKPAAESCEPGSTCAHPRAPTINKIALWVVTILAVGIMAFPYVVPIGSHGTTSNSLKTERAVLAVEGMTCNGCVLTVESSLKRVKGVRSAAVSLEPPRALVEFDPSLVTVEELVEATTRAGYPSRPLTGNEGGKDE